jgi:hypothetical protein
MADAGADRFAVEPGADGPNDGSGSPSIPEGWQLTDIGADLDAMNGQLVIEPMLTRSTAKVSSGLWTLTGSGQGFIHVWDQGALLYQSAKVTGDFTMTAFVRKLEMVVPTDRIDGAAQAMLNVRDVPICIGSNCESSSVILSVASPTGTKMQFRSRVPSRNHTPAIASLPPPQKAPLWLRLVRRENVFTASTSPDGTSWHPLSYSITLALAPAVHLGLACSARNDRAVSSDRNGYHLKRSARCEFSDVTITQP